MYNYAPTMMQQNYTTYPGLNTTNNNFQNTNYGMQNLNYNSTNYGSPFNSYNQLNTTNNNFQNTNYGMQNLNYNSTNYNNSPYNNYNQFDNTNNNFWNTNYGTQNLNYNSTNYNNSPYNNYNQFDNTNYYTNNNYNNFFMSPQSMMSQMPMIMQGQMFGEQSMPFSQGQVIDFMPQMPQMPQINPFMQMMQGLFAPQPAPFINQTTVDIGTAWGDPHFVVANSKGEKLTTDHKGKDNNTYNILDASGSDGLVIDAKYVENDADPDNPQVMGTIRVMAGDEELLFDKDGKITLDSKNLEKGNSYTTANGTEIKVLKNGNIDIISKDKDATISLLDQGDYLDIDIKKGSKLGNGAEKLGGVLGTLLNHKDKLADLNNDGKMDDIDGDGKSDDLNGNGFIDDNEWAKLGYNFDVTNERAIA